MPSDKSSSIEKAQQFAAKGQVDKAIKEWQKLIGKTHNDGNIYNMIGAQPPSVPEKIEKMSEGGEWE